MPLISTQRCNSSCMYAGELTGRMLCAGYPQGKIDACQVMGGCGQAQSGAALRLNAAVLPSLLCCRVTAGAPWSARMSWRGAWWASSAGVGAAPNQTARGFTPTWLSFCPGFITSPRYGCSQQQHSFGLSCSCVHCIECVHRETSQPALLLAPCSHPTALRCFSLPRSTRSDEKPPTATHSPLHIEVKESPGLIHTVPKTPKGTAPDTTRTRGQYK